MLQPSQSFVRVSAAGVVVACFLGCGGCNPQKVPPRSSQNSAATYNPHISPGLVDLDGRPVDLPRASSGRICVAVFVRSDCPVSNRLAPAVRQLCVAYAKQDVNFFLVYEDPRETVDAIRAHLREYEYFCPALRDTQHALAKTTEATVTPEAVVFNKKGMIVYRGRINDQFEDFDKMRASPTKNDLNDAIAATLAGQPVAAPVTKAVGCYISDLK
jgi:hypothetical protein